ncbi:MAG: recombinase family protein [Oscillospiraceae bacterium]
MLSQKRILKAFADNNGFLNTRYYLDDGVTGMTFEREGFQNMVSDIEKGEVKTVIVKDLSRLGRDHLMTGYFFFPANDIQFIAIYDNYDSENGDNEFAPFKNIFNEWFYSFLEIQNKPNAHKPTFPCKNPCRTFSTAGIFFISHSFNKVCSVACLNAVENCQSNQSTNP